MSEVLAGGFILFFLAVAIAGTAFWIWALVDAIRVPDDAAYQSGTKLIWVLVIVLTGWIGALIYVIVGRPHGGATAAIAARDAGRLPPSAGSIPPPPA